jgi:hypothetical protein
MFQKLLQDYKIKVDQYEAQKKDFVEQEKDVTARKEVQNKLIGGFKKKVAKELYVSNLAFTVNDGQLQSLFARYGTVQSAKVSKDRNSGRSKGCGFVKMSSDEESQAAITALNGVKLSGRALNVSEARPRPEGSGGMSPLAAEKIAQRIRLFQQQLQLTQGMQELELQKEEIQLLLKDLTNAKVQFEATARKDQAEVAQKGLTLQLTAVETKIRQLQKQKEENCLATLKGYTEKITPPKTAAECKDTAVTQNALALQQQRLLELPAAEAANVSRQQEYATTKKFTPEMLRGMDTYMDQQQTALATAGQLVAAHELRDETTKGIPKYGTATLSERGKAQTELLKQLRALVQEACQALETAAKTPSPVPKVPDAVVKLDEKTLGEIHGAGAVTQKLLADVQDAVQIVLTSNMKTDEMAKQSGAGFKDLQRLMTADPNKEPSPYLQTLLKNATRNVLRPLVAGSKNLTELGQKIAIHNQKGKLQEYQQKLLNVIQNKVVQGPFLLDKKNRLVRQPADEGDTDFFDLTNSAKDDYNDPKNLGKYTYHVTALQNILRTVGSGISAQGLSPSQGGKLGGSCEIADGTRDFSDTGVDIKVGSVVNSQNKVAASSNRDDAMRIYIKQREDHVAEEMKGGKADSAAKSTAIMLRFPIRAEYLGKFGKDPMHLSANLELLDGTPVPPKDIECLVHGQWIGITNTDFVATFKEMFGIK